MKIALAGIAALLALCACSQQSPADVAVASDAAAQPGAPTAVPATAAAPELAVAAGQSSLRLKIEGMHCEGCASGVAQRLKAVPGVADCAVSLEANQALVVYDPSATDAATLAAAAVEGTEYAVSPLP